MTRAARWRRLGAAMATAVGLVSGAPPLAGADANDFPVERRADLMRGMIVSCPTWGPIWGSPAMAETLDELSDLGVEWVSIHPYARIGRDGSVRFRGVDETPFLARAVELSRAAGIRLFWKPHLAYWGSFEWRGVIGFDDDEAAWRRFFDGYTAFIVDQAAFAEHHGVELFAVGVEYEATVHREADWRRVIAAVRRVYTGPITYAANWDGVDRVGFWDALDLIGVHAYFPLAEGPDPDTETLWRGWDAPLAALRRLSESHGGKGVVFAEIGYNRSPDAARTPWVYVVRDGAEARALRRRLLDVALRRAEEEPLVRGLFWWKWIPGDGRSDRDFSMRDAEAREALAESWGRPRRDPADAGGSSTDATRRP